MAAMPMWTVVTLSKAVVTMHMSGVTLIALENAGSCFLLGCPRLFVDA